MTNPIPKEAEMRELKHEEPFATPAKAETNEETSMSVTDPDAMLGMTVLLLACLTLAVLAHVLV